MNVDATISRFRPEVLYLPKSIGTDPATLGNTSSWMKTHLLCTVKKRIRNIPTHTILHSQPPRQTRLVQIHQQAHRQIPQLNILKVKARTWRVEKGRQTRQQQRQVAEPRDARDERARR